MTLSQSSDLVQQHLDTKQTQNTTISKPSWFSVRANRLVPFYFHGKSNKQLQEQVQSASDFGVQ